MKTNSKIFLVALSALMTLSCAKEEPKDEPKDPVASEHTFTASFEDFVPGTKVSLTEGTTAVKASWTGNEYILVSNGTSDVVISDIGNISGEGAEWIEASSCTISDDGKTISFTTSLETGEKWYMVATDNKVNLSYLSASGDLTTNPVTYATAATIGYVGYAVVASDAENFTFKNVMSYLSFGLKDSYYAVTIESAGENAADFCQQVGFDADYKAAAGIGSSKTFTVLTASGGDKFYVPVTPVGAWEQGLVIKMWEKDAFENMASSLPLKSATIESFVAQVNTVTDLGLVDDFQIPASFSYEIPAQDGPVNPSLFNSLGKGSRWFSIMSTVPWTASVNTAETTASDVNILTTSGQGNLSKFEIIVGPNTDFKNRKTVVIDIKPEGLDPVKVTLEQEKASVITLEFCNQDLSGAVWPFIESHKNIYSGEEVVAGTYTIGEYAFNYSSKEYNKWEEEKMDWIFGSAGGYIDLPAIEGWKLTRVSLYDKNGTAAISLQNSEGADITATGKKDVEKNAVTSLEISRPYNNTSYRFAVVTNSAGTSKTLRIMSLTLEYAEATAADNPPTEQSGTFTCQASQGTYIESSVFSSLGCGSRWFAISSTVPWTASVNTAETTASDVVLKTTSGEGNLEKFEVTVGPNTDMENRKKIVIDFQPVGLEPVKYELIQEKGSIISVEFSDQVDASPVWPFVGPSDKESLSTAGEFVTASGHKFPYSAPSGVYLEDSKRALRADKDAVFSIDTPAIEGYKLVKVRALDQNGNTAPEIVTTSGEAVEGGSGVKMDKLVWTEWNLSGTVVNTSYRYRTTNTAKTVRLSYLVLEYSK